MSDSFENPDGSSSKLTSQEEGEAQLGRERETYEKKTKEGKDTASATEDTAPNSATLPTVCKNLDCVKSRDQQKPEKLLKKCCCEPKARLGRRSE